MGKRVILLLAILTISHLAAAYDFCDETTPENQLEIYEIIDSSQKDEINWEWEPTETVTITIELKNKNFTRRKFELELFFADENDDLINLTESTLKKTITLTNSKTTNTSFSFTLDEPEEESYSLYAKLSDPNNETICTSLKAYTENEEATITIIPEERLVTMKNPEGPTNITAGENAEYATNITNIGNHIENKVLAILYNANLDIRLEIEIEKLNVEESRLVTFNVAIPENATPQQERFLFAVEYDYDETRDYYQRTSEKDKVLLVEILSNENKSTQDIKENQTTTETTQTQTTDSEQQDSTSERTPYFWITLITIASIILIIIITFFIIRYKAAYPKATSSPSSAQKIKEYVSKINNPNSIPPSKPSEKNTAHKPVPQPSQTSPPKPNSSPRPQVKTSSPKSTPAKPASPSPKTPQKPQTRQPSPQTQSPNKTSSQQPAPAKPQASQTNKANKAQAATRQPSSSPRQSSSQTKRPSDQS